MEKGSYIPKPGGPTPLPLKPTCPRVKILCKPSPGGGPPDDKWRGRDGGFNGEKSI